MSNYNTQLHRPPSSGAPVSASLINTCKTATNWVYFSTIEDMEV